MPSDEVYTAPLRALLGLPVTGELEPTAVTAAFKQAMRQPDVSNVEALRQAYAVLRSPEAASAYMEEQQKKSSFIGGKPALVITSRPRYSTDQSGSKPAAAGRPAYGFAVAKGKRPSMEDELVLGVPIERAGCSPLFAFGVFDGHGGSRAAKLAARQLQAALSRAAAAVSLQPLPEQKEEAGSSTGAASSTTVGEAALLPIATCVSAFEELEAKILLRAEADQWERGNDDGSCALVALVAPERRGAVQLMQLGDCNAMALECRRTASCEDRAAGGSGSMDAVAAVRDAGTAADADGEVIPLTTTSSSSAASSSFSSSFSSSSSSSSSSFTSATATASATASASASASASAAAAVEMAVSAHAATGEQLLCPAHRPAEAAEAARLRAMGAEVSATGRVNGLAVSRCLGDRLIKEARPAVLLAVPEVIGVDLATHFTMDPPQDPPRDPAPDTAGASIGGGGEGGGAASRCDKDDEKEEAGCAGGSGQGSADLADPDNAAPSPLAPPPSPSPPSSRSSLLVLACDGLWDFLPPHAARETVDRIFRGLEQGGSSTGGSGSGGGGGGGGRGGSTGASGGGASEASAEARLEQAARALVDAALDRGSDDNVSVVVVAL